MSDLMTDPPVDLSRRERKKLLTHQALRTHALRLFTERGFDGTTVQDITEAADVAPRTFFLHYASKEDVLIGDARAGVEAFGHMLASRPADEEPYASVRECALAGLGDSADALTETALLSQLIQDTPHLLGRLAERYIEYEDLITDSVAARFGLDPLTDAYPRLLAACTMTAVRVGQALWFTRGATGPLEPVVAEVFDELGSGLARRRSA